MDDLLEAVPILRIFDEQLAKEFYVGYLGFTLGWEHRFEDNLPLCAQVSRGAVRLHLSKHHGDGTPGGHERPAAGRRHGPSAAPRHRGSPSYSIGVVTAWEPGEHFAQSFTLGIDPGHPTTLDVRFSDWPHLLDRYRAMS